MGFGVVLAGVDGMSLSCYGLMGRPSSLGSRVTCMGLWMAMRGLGAGGDSLDGVVLLLQKAGR